MKENIFTPSLNKIKVTDDLFGKYADMVAEKLIPYQWEILNDRIPDAEKSYCISNFRIAAGEKEGRHQGYIFSDTDVYKWLETLAFCLEAGKAKEFEPLADKLIELIGRAQEPDGYLNTYFSVNCPELKWTNFAEGHELYSAGHLFEAAVAYHAATGKSRILEISCRFADLICRIFAPGTMLEQACPGHPEVELALLKLSAATGEKKYSEMAYHFVSVRGMQSNFLMENLASQGENRIFPEFADYDALYAQTHISPEKQTTAEGHAVRAMYLYSAMTDLAREYGDDSMKNACLTLWENVTQKRMYITGGLGSSGHLERFTADYDLPNDRMYCESCASVGLMMYGKRMAMLTGEAKYYDAVERALCNTVLAGIAAEGDKYFYVNPLEIWPENCLPSTSMSHVKPVRQPWFACACCPPNIARTLASVGQYIYAQSEKSLFVNQFISSELMTEIQGSPVTLKLHSEMMTRGKVSILIDSGEERSFILRIRIPPYLNNVHFMFDGNDIFPAIENGYAVIAVSHKGIQTLELLTDVRPQFAAANTNVRADIGRVALTYGPFVYCLEEEDNGANLSSLYVSPSVGIEPEPHCGSLPGNLPTLKMTGKRLESFYGNELYSSPDFTLQDAVLRAVPYGLWGNRNPGEMTVWMKALI